MLVVAELGQVGHRPKGTVYDLWLFVLLLLLLLLCIVAVATVAEQATTVVVIRDSPQFRPDTDTGRIQSDGGYPVQRCLEANLYAAGCKRPTTLHMDS